MAIVPWCRELLKEEGATAGARVTGMALVSQAGGARGIWGSCRYTRFAEGNAPRPQHDRIRSGGGRDVSDPPASSGVGGRGWVSRGRTELTRARRPTCDLRHLDASASSSGTARGPRSRAGPRGTGRVSLALDWH